MDNREVVLGTLRTLDEEGAAAFAGRLAPDAELMSALGTFKGQEEIEQFLTGMMAAFPGSSHTVSAVIAEGDTVVVEGTWDGTHSAPLQTPQGEVPATGRSISLPFAGIARVQDGRVVSLHNYFDQVAFMAQLGLMPEPATA